MYRIDKNADLPRIILFLAFEHFWGLKIHIYVQSRWNSFQFVLLFIKNMMTNLFFTKFLIKKAFFQCNIEVLMISYKLWMYYWFTTNLHSFQRNVHEPGSRSSQLFSCLCLLIPFIILVLTIPEMKGLYNFKILQMSWYDLHSLVWP